MEEDSKFEFLEIIDNVQIQVSVTRKLKCEWNNKQFVLNHKESTKSNKFYWMEGEEQFTQEERYDIEEYLYQESGEAFWLDE